MESGNDRSEEHTSELQSRLHLVCRLLLEKKKNLQCHPPPLHTITTHRDFDLPHQRLTRPHHACPLSHRLHSPCTQVVALTHERSLHAIEVHPADACQQEIVHYVNEYDRNKQTRSQKQIVGTNVVHMFRLM